MQKRNGICCAGNMIVDITYPISTWPNQNELVHITEGITSTIGGAACNTALDLARLDNNLKLSVSGFAGHDAEGDFIIEEMSKFKNIDLSMVRREGKTSFTAVMSNNQTKERTFFQYAGSNADYNENHIDFEALKDTAILHIGYILLLPALDQEDETYGTKMARLLHNAQKSGLKTSIDVVSEMGRRFKKLVIPSLKYSDYCIINELEASQTTGIELRTCDGTLKRENMKAALEKLFELGISTWSVIHCPEAGFGLDTKGNFVVQNSLELPKSYIKGTVGAGDAFCAGVLYSAHQNDTLQNALRLAVCTASVSLSCPGGTEGVCSVDEVLKLYDRYPPK